MRKLQFGTPLLLLGFMLAALVACGDEPATPTPMPATASDMALISAAIIGTKNLTSYHQVLTGSGNVFTQSFSLESDLVSPDQLYTKGSMGNQPVEELTTGGQVYTKAANGNWTVAPPASSAGSEGG